MSVGARQLIEPVEQTLLVSRRRARFWRPCVTPRHQQHEGKWGANEHRQKCDASQSVAKADQPHHDRQPTEHHGERDLHRNVNDEQAQALRLGAEGHLAVHMDDEFE